MIHDSFFFSKKAYLIEQVLFCVSSLLVVLSLYMIFMVVPNEAVMGAIQRIFYFHASSAIVSYVGFGIVFVSSICYLSTRNRLFDAINEAAAEVGFLFCSITLVSGMIWAKTAWNVWFRWEPRLVSFLLLWMVFAGFLLLRSSAHYAQRESHSAVLGIIGASVIPLVWWSVKLLPQIAQLHPQVVDRGGLAHPLFRWCFLLSILTLFLFSCSLIWWRTKLALFEQALFDATLESTTSELS